MADPNYLWETTMLLCILGILILVVAVAMIKYIQLSRIQNAIEKAWFNKGICGSLGNQTDCQLHYVDELPDFPTDGMISDTFEPIIARKLADFVARIEMVENNVNVKAPPNYIEVDHYKPALSPVFGISHMYGNDVMIISFRCTMTHSEIQNDLYAYQKKFDTGEVYNIDFPSTMTTSYINGEESYVHAGFHNIYSRYRANIVQTIEKHKPKYIYLTGHSLGGSVATLYAVYLAELAEQSNYSFIQGISGYVFGTPRVGNQHFHERLISCPKLLNFWRVANEYDNIQDLPYRVTPNFKDPTQTTYYYEHSGRGYNYKRNWGSWQRNHFLPNYIYELNALLGYV